METRRLEGNYRAAVIGCGHQGSLADPLGPCSRPRSHAGMYAAHPRFQILAACDRDPERLQAFGKSWETVHLFPDPDVLFSNTELDVVSITTPPDSHAELLRAAVRAGVPLVVLEKPVAVRSRDVEGLADEIRDSSTRVVVSYQRHWGRNFVMLADHIRSGRLGRISRVQVYYPESVVAMGSHAIDLLRWYFGPIRWARAVDAPVITGEDFGVDFILGWDDGMRAGLVGCPRRPWNVFEMDFLGSEGRVRVSRGGRIMEFFRVETDPDFGRLSTFSPMPAPFPNDWESTYLNLADHLVNLLDNPGMRPGCSLVDGLYALKVAETVIASARNGHGRIDLS